MEPIQKKIFELLNFYKKNGTPINITNRKTKARFGGDIIKLNKLFGNPYCIIDNVKIYLEDIDCDSILPQDKESILVRQEEEAPKEKRKQIPLAVKKELWGNYFGDQFKGKCFVCKEQILRDDYEAGHVVPASKGGPDTIENLRPICKPCNRSMGDQDLYEYKNQYQ